jgi:hypothetical protein
MGNVGFKLRSGPVDTHVVGKAAEDAAPAEVAVFLDDAT